MALTRSNDRILVLEKEDPKGKEGLLDPRVFDGNNNLRITLNPASHLWNFRYEHGTVPPALRGKFTSFKEARDHAVRFLSSKKIKIVDVKD